MSGTRDNLHIKRVFMLRYFLPLVLVIGTLACSSSRNASRDNTAIPVSTREIPEYSAEDLAQAQAYYIEGITAF